MHVAARVRFVLARRPWIYWTLVAALAAAAGLVVHSELTSIGQRRDAWGETRTVLVADGDHAPGDPLETAPAELPEAMIPPSAIDEVPAGASLRHHVADGEVLVDIDFVAHGGPATRASSGTVVVSIVDPLVRNVAPGDRVQVAAEGELVAAGVTIVDVVDEVTFVAVEPADAAAVAAASRAGTATLIYVP